MGHDRFNLPRETANGGGIQVAPGARPRILGKFEGWTLRTPPSTHNGTDFEPSAGGVQTVSVKVEPAEETDPGLEG